MHLPSKILSNQKLLCSAVQYMYTIQCTAQYEVAM